MPRRVIWGVLVAFLLGCSAPAKPGASPSSASAPREVEGRASPGSEPAPMPVAGASDAKGAKGAPLDAAARLSLADARRYMVTLINRDRATMGLSPVELDLGAPTKAGQAHAEDMAAHGYLGHWGTDGSVPEQRLTEAGGSDMVLENALCFIDEAARTLDAAPTLDPREIVRAEDMFFNEKPPNDGHRRNILKAAHRRVGIGVAQPIKTKSEIPVPCFAQEFTDPYGTYAAVPSKLKLGATLHVEGDVHAPAAVGGVGLARVASPHALPVAEVNRRRSYPVPTPYQVYWPKGFKTPIPVAVTGEHFAIDLPVNDNNQPGLYELSIWAKMPGSPEFVMIGLRTIRVDR